MKYDGATSNANGRSHGNPSVGRQTFFKAAFLPAVVLGILTLCLSCAHLSAKPVLVVFETELGNITVEVDVVHAPITGTNFLKYVDGKFYDGGMINRAVRPDNTVRHDVEVQVIQFQSDPAREREMFPPIPMERTSVTGLRHVNGVLSMARDGPDTAQDSFSIVIGDQPEMDFGGRRNPDGQGFAVFGRVVTGMDAVKRIHQAHTGMSGPYKTETLEPPIRILKAYRKEQVKGQILAQAEARDKAAEGGIQRETRDISGWTVHINRTLLATNAAVTERALELLKAQLEGIVRAVPAVAVAELRKVSLWVSPEYPIVKPRAEYHPSAGWLREHGRDPVMAKGVEFTNVRIFESETKRMPVFALHELAHAYHDRVLPQGFGNPQIKAAYEKAKAIGKYDQVERRDARGRVSIDRAYAMTNPQEYFAETTEAFFGTNDFFPFTRAELKQHDPEMFALLEKLWNLHSERGNTTK
ncbi:MAG: zinc-dependent peptidase [Verrucomicrobia bacterium]|nr:zinc-dependent peptidase [Verrucomicrobiota bacterium]